MRLTPFRQGRLDGWKRAELKTKFTGKNRKSYLSGYRIGAISHIFRLIAAEENPVETITDPMGS